MCPHGVDHDAQPQLRVDRAAPAVSGPLQRVRVIDIATLFAGPTAATVLADYGASVIKVEHPRGDPVRNHGFSKVAVGSDGEKPESGVCRCGGATGFDLYAFDEEEEGGVCRAGD